MTPRLCLAYTQVKEIVMPTDERPGKKGVYIELPTELLAEVRALAERNGRDFRSEVEHALRRHAAAPPTVRIVVDTPELAAAEVEAGPPKAPYRADGDGIGLHSVPKKSRTKKQQ